MMATHMTVGQDWTRPCLNLCTLELRLGERVGDLEPLHSNIRSWAEQLCF
jgi:hypothetical protein